MTDRWKQILLKYKEWFVFTMVICLVFCMFLWLSDIGSFYAILPSVILAAVILYVFMGLWLDRRDRKKEKDFMRFLEKPGSSPNEIELLSMNDREIQAMGLIGERIEMLDHKIRDQEADLAEYEEYIESWAHEIKTPLALMTFVLDNRNDEMSSAAYRRLEYVQTNIEENVERMLYYARIKNVCTDYVFEQVSLSDICGEVLCGYENLLKEQKIRVINEVEDLHVLSDKKGLSFLIRQAVSNSLKYAGQKAEASFLKLYTKRDAESGDVTLAVRDNGIGVKPWDLPFLFEKGFTGDTEEKRKNSTGMGLYLAKQTADSLGIQIEIPEDYTEGFEIIFRFCKV